jgi:DNA topoisomerase-1
MAKEFSNRVSLQRKNNRKFLGSDYQVESSYGHTDLPSKEIGVDVENGKPKYEVSADKSIGY